MLCVRSISCLIHSPHSVLTESLVEDTIRVLLPILHVLINCFLVVIELNFVINEGLVLVSAKRIKLKVKIKSWHHLFFTRFIRLLVSF